MRRKFKIGTLLATGLLVANVHATTNIPETVAGNLTVNLGVDPSAADVYSVVHTTKGAFTDVYDFAVASSSLRNSVASYASLSLTSLLGITNPTFGLYTSGGVLVQAGSVTSIGLNQSIGTISKTGLAGGSYYYQFAGVSVGHNGGAYQFAQVISPVPEPSTYALMLMGLCAIGYAVVRQQRGATPQMGLELAA